MKKNKIKNIPVEKRNRLNSHICWLSFWAIIFILSISILNSSYFPDLFSPTKSVVKFTSLMFVIFSPICALSFIALIRWQIQDNNKFKNEKYSEVWNELSSILDSKEYWVESARMVNDNESKIYCFEKNSYEIVFNSKSHFLCFHCYEGETSCKRIEKTGGKVIDDPELENCLNDESNPFKTRLLEISKDFIKKNSRGNKSESFFNNISEHLKNNQPEFEEKIDQNVNSKASVTKSSSGK